jgi:hypothetical protein
VREAKYTPQKLGSLPSPYQVGNTLLQKDVLNVLPQQV